MFSSLLRCTVHFTWCSSRPESARQPCSFVSVVAAVACRPLRGLSPMSFSPHLKRQTQHLTELISMVSSPYTLLRRLRVCIGLEPSTVRNSDTSPCRVRASTVSAILHCCGIESTSLTGPPMILVELDSVADWWVRKETLLGAAFKSVFLSTFAFDGMLGISRLLSAPD
jgi:hypothetical protein